MSPTFPRAAPLRCEPGRPWPMGVTIAVIDGRTGLNAAVFARDATAVDLCLYGRDGRTETGRVRLAACTDGVWHGFVRGLCAGQRYGLRVHGPWQPGAGHRHNPVKLLIDPWARSLPGPIGALALESGHCAGSPDERDLQDNADRMPKACVLDLEAELRAGAAITPGPDTPMARTFLYEAHVKSLTALHPAIPPGQRGTWTGLASAPMLAHYARLGITALCLLPVHLHLDERQLIERGLTNHWGYNTLSFFVPDPRFATAAARGAAYDDDAVRAEFRQMVDTLHRAGIEVILDVVYNHSAEGDTLGPTLSWRGLGNAAWYALDDCGRHLNPTGCGNTFNMGEPHVIQLIMDSLRWWVQAYGVDGFRFDLATSLGRDPALGQRFQAHGALFGALAQDPVLAPVKLIAEPWDVGPDGYQLGRFGPRWHEWNDRFRDTVRAWWLGHDCTRGQFARCLAGSSDLFQSGGRGPLASVNLITAHDGFTLADLTAYTRKHNEANGEGNRDGHDGNLGANGGCEGPTDDPTITLRRAQWRRALLSTLLCAQGTPQLLAGDELCHSQQGNNNAYCQDNPITWLDWATADTSMTGFVAALAGLRRRYPALRHAHWFHGEWAATDAPPDMAWRTADGQPPDVAAWERPDGRLLACVITVGNDGQSPREKVMLILHGGVEAIEVRLPDGHWQLVLDSASGWVANHEATNQPPVAAMVASSLLVTPPTVRVLIQMLPEPNESRE